MNDVVYDVEIWLHLHCTTQTRNATTMPSPPRERVPAARSYSSSSSSPSDFFLRKKSMREMRLREVFFLLPSSSPCMLDFFRRMEKNPPFSFIALSKRSLR